MRYQNIGSIFSRFVTKHTCDGQTRIQNYDPQNRASIAASRGKNYISFGKSLHMLLKKICKGITLLGRTVDTRNRFEVFRALRLAGV